MKKYLIFACMILLLFCNAEAKGLDAFAEKTEYTEGRFSDVAAGAWYEEGIKTVYKKGIMNGVSEETFAPSETVSWAQAVTIAARLSAAYSGEEIQTAEGVWYAPFVEYAKLKKLLPDVYPHDEQMAETEITREALAGLFSKIFTKEDLPRINSRAVPDMDVIDDVYQDAVADMYAAGIITGMENGGFAPKNKTTRAEIATIISRLLNPGQRVGYDEKVSPFMEAFGGNFYNGGLAVTVKDNTYYLYCSMDGDAEKNFKIISRNREGKIEDIYTTKERLSYLSVWEDGKLLFVEGKTLVCLAPDTGKKEIFYKTLDTLDCYGIYNGEIYIVESGADLKSRIFLLSETWTKEIVHSLSFAERLYLDKKLYFYHNKMYTCIGEVFSDGSREYSIYEIDLSTLKKTKILSDVSMENVCFVGASVYYLKDYNKEGTELIRFNLKLPQYKETVAIMPPGCSINYRNIFANGNQIYIQSSGAQRLWSVSINGKAEEIATLKSTGYEQTMILHDHMILALIKNISQYLLSSIEVVDLKTGEKTNYSAFLEETYITSEPTDFEKKESSVREKYAPSELGPCTMQPKESYFTAKGDYVVSIGIIPAQKPIQLTGLLFKLKIGDRIETTQFMLFDQLNAETEAVYTIVYPRKVMGEIKKDDKIGFNIALKVK